MNYQRIQQQTAEWWAVKVGKVSGTRFGQLISTRENSLIDELANEILDGQCEYDDFENEDMQFGTENEPVAIDMYEQMTGIKFERGGVIISDTFPNTHMASPDAVNLERGIVLEVKCTMHGKTQIKRFRKGVDSDKMGQIINYFACSDDVKEVHWISYCPFRPERPMVVYIFTRDTVLETKETKARGIETVTINDKVIRGRMSIMELETEVENLVKDFKTIQF